MILNRQLQLTYLAVIVLAGCATPPPTQTSTPPASTPPSSPSSPSTSPGQQTPDQSPSQSPSQSEGQTGDQSADQTAEQTGESAAESEQGSAEQQSADQQATSQQGQADQEPGWPGETESSQDTATGEQSQAEQDQTPSAEAEDPWADTPEAEQTGNSQGEAGPEGAGATGTVTEAREAGSAGAPGSGMPADSSGNLPAGGFPSAQTPEERAAELDRVLSGSMVVFDGTMLEEQKRAQAVRQGAIQQGTTGADTIPGLEKQAPADEEASGEIQAANGDESPRGDDSQGKGSTVAGAPGNRSGVTPADIPSGDDDDVVARQLREAAEAETDPALREKLWDEYRRYKNGAGN
jgi:hypothetical protein